MNCIIVEDQLPAQRILKKYISDIGSLHLVGCYTDPMEAMEVINSKKIDILFLDIHLPKISGLDFLKSLTTPPQVVLTTAFQNYALEGYELDVVDYLLKPFSFQRFVKAVSKIKKEQIVSESDNISYDKGSIPLEDIYIKIGYDFIKVKLDNINYILTDSDYTELHLQDKKLLSSESLLYWEDLLPNNFFFRVHKSFIVNTSKINKISRNQIFLDGGHQIPIGRVYKSKFMKLFMS